MGKSEADPKRGRGRAARAPATAAIAGAEAGPVRVLDRAMLLLRFLSQRGGPATLAEISRETGLNKATALRFLRSFETGGFVAAGPEGRGWRIGPVFFDIRARALDSVDLRDVARPAMEEACRRTGQTVQLAVLADDSIAYIEKVEPPDLPVRINTQIGTRRPIHCTALGKALAAYRSAAEVEQIVRAVGLNRYTPQTIISAAALQEELARVRRDGFAIDDREFNELCAAVAAPVRDASGRVIAALSIAAIGLSASSARFAELVPQAVRAAGAISAALGWAPGRDAAA